MVVRVRLPVEEIVRYLVESEGDGVICLEHEPLYSDPMPEVAESLQRLRAWLAE